MMASESVYGRPHSGLLAGRLTKIVIAGLGIYLVSMLVLGADALPLGIVAEHLIIPAFTGIINERSGRTQRHHDCGRDQQTE